MGFIETIVRNLKEIFFKTPLIMISWSASACSCDRLADLWGDLGTQEGKDYLDLGILKV